MKQYLFIILLVCLSFFCSCGDPALEVEYGKAIIYMPQATKNLGTDNNLSVTLMPSVNSDTTITIGIYRSGLQTKQGVSVDLTINADTIPKAWTIAQDPLADVKYSIYKTGVLLTSDYYDALPTLLTIQEGNRDATTGLVIHKAKILTDYAAGSILLLPVQIKNPTLYEINPDLSLTMVVLTVGT